MESKKDIARRIGFIEGKISEGESLMRKFRNQTTISVFFILFGLLTICTFFTSNKLTYALAFGLLIFLPGILGYTNAKKKLKEVEDGLSKYRAEKAELHSLLLTQK